MGFFCSGWVRCGSQLSFVEGRLKVCLDEGSDRARFFLAVVGSMKRA